jgi:hypothetical protein
MCGFDLQSFAINGDVVLDLEHGKISGQSDVLMRASPVFKAMLGPNFSEGQGTRSAANPKIIKLEDDDFESMVILCVLLHRVLNTVNLDISSDAADTADATRIFQVAVLADKYALVDNLSNDIGPTLLAPFTGTLRARKLDLLEALHLVVVAYLLQQDELFTLFARRLILDYGNLPTMLEYTDLFDHIPATSIRKLDQMPSLHRLITNYKQCNSKTSTLSFGHVSTQRLIMLRQEPATCVAQRSTTAILATPSCVISNPKKTTGHRTTLSSTLSAMPWSPSAP